MKSIGLVLLFTGIAAQAQNTAPAADTALNTCKTLAAAAVKKDFATVEKWTLSQKGPKMGKLSEKGFEKMHQEHMTKLQGLNCTTEFVAEDRAVVEAATTEGKRLIPFVKTTEGWRFDAKTYMSFYNFGPKHGPKGKM